MFGVLVVRAARAAAPERGCFAVSTCDRSSSKAPRGCACVACGARRAWCHQAKAQKRGHCALVKTKSLAQREGEARAPLAAAKREAAWVGRWMAHACVCGYSQVPSALRKVLRRVWNILRGPGPQRVGRAMGGPWRRRRPRNRTCCGLYMSPTRRGPLLPIADPAAIYPEAAVQETG